jgi:CBS domain-containing protein
MPTVQDILTHKGTGVFTVSPETSVLDATRLMNQHRIGALVVVHQHRLVGIFTERDVLTRVLGCDCPLSDLQVADVMTRDVVTSALDTDLADVSETMRSRRIRHMPVCDPDGRLRGLISIGDINAAHAEHREMHLQQLSDYVYGRV